jgi:hypothetical protein
MERSFTLLFILCTAAAHAQIIDQGNSAPVAGSSFIIDRHVGYIDAGLAGAAQTWDLSSLSPSSAPATVSFQDATSTGYATDLPNANLASSASPDFFLFYTVNSAGITYRGSYLVPASEEIVYQDPELLVSYPADWGAFWSDGFTSDYTQGGQSHWRVGSIWCLADGYGTLLMPYGTVTNVLRVKTEETYTDSLVGVPGATAEKHTTYAYFKPGTHLPLVQLHEDTVNVPGGPLIEHRSDWI